MYPLLILALYLYYAGFEVCLKMRRYNSICGDDKKFDKAYKTFVAEEFFADSKNKSEVEKKINEPNDAKKYFSALRLELLSGVDRRLLTLKILSGVAPLIGLLGTVCGMTVSIASATSDNTAVAAGISSALVTTQAGLVVAIPAWIIAMFATAQTQKLLITLAKRESAAITGGAQ